ncbi:MAG: helix-turn-helix transcriptional regulator [Acidimicrobiales bacterium]
MSTLAAALVQRIAERAPLHLDGDGAHWLHVLAAEIEPSPAGPLTLPNPPAGPAGDLAALLEADPGRPESLDDLAALVGASRRTIERSFRSATGLSAGAWRRRLRLATALEDLGAGMAVGTVATRAGYASQSAFGAAFRTELGASPLSYMSVPRGPAA